MGKNVTIKKLGNDALNYLSLTRFYELYFKTSLNALIMPFYPTRVITVFITGENKILNNLF